MLVSVINRSEVQWGAVAPAREAGGGSEAACERWSGASVQLEVGLKSFYVKLHSEEKFKTIVSKDSYQFDHGDGAMSTVKIADAGGMGTRVLRVFRLPVEVSNEHVVTALAQYGTVVDCYYERWSNYEFKGAMNGIRGVKMNLKKDVPSYMKICGVEVLILYDGQPKTCRTCHQQGHLYFDCQERPKNRRRWETVNSAGAASGQTPGQQPANNINNALPVIATNNNNQPANSASSPTREATDESTSGEDAGERDGEWKEGGGRRKGRKRKSGAKPPPPGLTTPGAAAAALGAGSTPPKSSPPRSSLSDHQAVELDKIFQFIEDQRGTVSFADQDRATLHVSEGGTYQEFLRLETATQTQLGGVIAPTGKRKAGSPKHNSAKHRATGDTSTDSDDDLPK